MNDLKDYILVSTVQVARKGARCPTCRGPMTQIKTYRHKKDTGDSAERRYIAEVADCRCQMQAIAKDA